MGQNPTELCQKSDLLTHLKEGGFLGCQKYHSLKCGHTENADFNASKVIKGRGIKALQSHLEAVSNGTFRAKVKKTVRVRKVKKNIQEVGQVLPEPMVQTESSKPVALCGIQILKEDLGESTLDVAYDHVVWNAALVEAGNPHLGTRPGGG